MAQPTGFEFVMTNMQPLYQPNPRRAGCKIAIIVAGLLLLAFALGYSIDDPGLSRLKFNLSIWSMIVIVLIINILSCVCFLILYVAYQWVRCDLKAPRAEDERDQDSL